MKEHFIEAQVSTPYTPKSNGVIERGLAMIMERGRAALHDSELPMRFWADALVAAAYVLNRTPTVANKDGEGNLILKGNERMCVQNV